MNRFHHIALRIALQEETGAAPFVESLVSDKMKQAMDIPLDVQSFAEGVSSAVFENAKGHIVSFLREQRAHAFASGLIGKENVTLPMVYETEMFEVEDTPERKKTREEMGYEYTPMSLFAIEMEKLEVLDEEEKDYIAELVGQETHDRGYTFLESYIHKGMSSELKEKLEADVFGQAILDLFGRLSKEPFFHDDLKLENIAWTPQGTLKAIDFGSIDSDGLQSSIRDSLSS